MSCKSLYGGVDTVSKQFTTTKICENLSRIPCKFDKNIFSRALSKEKFPEVSDQLPIFLRFIPIYLSITSRVSYFTFEMDTKTLTSKYGAFPVSQFYEK